MAAIDADCESRQQTVLAINARLGYTRRFNYGIPAMRILVVLALLIVSASAEAYIGPGAGLSFLGSLWAVLVGIVLALVAILSWPIRLLWRRLRGTRAAPTAVAKEDVSENESQ